MVTYIYFATRVDSNRPAQLMRLARVLKFWLQQVEVLHYPGSEQQRCWSDCADAQADLRVLFTYGMNRFSHGIYFRYDVHTSNGLQDIRQNHCTMKYRSRWPTFILRSCVRSYWFIIPNDDVHTWNSLKGIITGPWNIGHSDLHLF